VRFWSAGVHAAPFGYPNGPYEFLLQANTLHHRWPGQTGWVLSGNKIGGSGLGSAFYSKQWLQCGQEGVNQNNPAWTFESYWAVKSGTFPQPGFWVGFSLADEGFETIQGTTYNSLGVTYEIGDPVAPCSTWTMTLGFCQSSGQLGPGGISDYNYNFLDNVWWKDNICADNLPNCGERQGQAHGRGVPLTSRTSPTAAYSTYSTPPTASTEGGCP
jgi:hypothetical protein